MPDLQAVRRIARTDAERQIDQIAENDTRKTRRSTF
jgi:hypothetical protein